ncbi:hypothetical protein [Aurantiacibacter zhengii]|uniref:TerL n=1 Tax=Aurantiacibacter zhengii TaxID=2307003 RepID=A0A418NTL8_9SPHN|nr:hypothetical protein [Aurantiacibacter zhengii]RIV87492.1 hypothetical protein D2V07_03840 [Aurantiacibacter zhengii]
MTTRDLQIKRLNSPGPISDAFLQSRAFLKIIIGPVGSAKTITALRALRKVGQKQGGEKDAQGVYRRKARVGVIRETYPNIEKNTLPSWFDIHPEAHGKFTWKAPYTHKLVLILGVDPQTGKPNDVCDFEIEFRAIGDRSVEEACRGWQVCAVMVDEADLQPPDLLAFLSGRVGRGGTDTSKMVDPQIILSLNMPYTDNWVYELAMEGDIKELETPELLELLGDRPLMEVFVQPGGRQPDAENLHNLPKGYYQVQAALNKSRPDYVARMIDNKPVPMRHGQPVNPQFDYQDHVRPLEWDKQSMLIIGMDQGLNAAATFCQRTPEGGLRTLREAVLFSENGTLAKVGGKAFGQFVRYVLNENFPDVHPEYVRVVCDPAAWKAQDNADENMDWVRQVRKALGLWLNKAKSNSPSLRNGAIWQALDERGGYAVDPKCKHLIKGHLGGYRYMKGDMKDGETRGHLRIADTAYTHICDAEQYAALEGDHIITDLRGLPQFDPSKFVVESDFDIFTGA